MTDKDTDELITAWHRFFANIHDKNKREPDHWAALKIHRLLYDSWVVPEDNAGILDDPERAWQIILLLLEASPSRQGVIAVNADPMRQLMDSYFDDFIERVRQEARNNPRLSYALSHLHVDNEEHRIELTSLGNRAISLQFADETKLAQQEKIDRIVADWFQFHRAADPEERESYYWAVTEVSDELPDIDPNTCWAVILVLLEKASSGAELLAVGFEIGGLLSFNYADFIGTVRNEVAHNKRLAYALRNAYLPDDQKTEWTEFIALLDQHRMTDDPFIS